MLEVIATSKETKPPYTASAVLGSPVPPSPPLTDSNHVARKIVTKTFCFCCNADAAGFASEA
jgi:hypothetical protein